jgi:hypothetical protein
MSRSWWSVALQWAAWAVAMALVMGWLARSRMRARAGSGAPALRHPPGILAIGLVGFALFAGITVISNVYPNRTTTWWTTAVFAGFALMNAVLIADYFRSRHALIEGGLDYGRLVGGRGRLRWADVTRVRYAPGMKWFKVETAAGRAARVSATMTGLPQFAEAVLRHVRPAAIEAETHAVLEATARGNPPPVW